MNVIGGPNGLPGVPGMPGGTLTFKERCWYEGYLSAMRHALEYATDAPTVAKSHFQTCVNYLEVALKEDEREDEMDACPRVVTKEQLIAGLKAGKICYIDRRDAPELEDLLALERQGLVASELEDIEPQYSRLRFWWVGPKD